MRIVRLAKGGKIFCFREGGKGLFWFFLFIYKCFVSHMSILCASFDTCWFLFPLTLSLSCYLYQSTIAANRLIIHCWAFPMLGWRSLARICRVESIFNWRWNRRWSTNNSTQLPCRLLEEGRYFSEKKTRVKLEPTKLVKIIKLLNVVQTGKFSKVWLWIQRRPTARFRLINTKTKPTHSKAILFLLPQIGEYNK
jgi:hypothetical protein